MEYFNHSDNSEVIFIPTVNVLISEPIIKAVNKLGGAVPKDMLIDFQL